METLEQLQASIEALATRLTHMEDVEAIKQLKALYCEICDDGHDPDRIITLFTEDAIWEGRGIGRAQGHAEIRTLFTDFAQRISFSAHMVMNPRISVDGDRARGTWYFLGPFTFVENNQGKWQAARYHEEYRKEAGQWKISHLQVKGPGMSADYHRGWAD